MLTKKSFQSKSRIFVKNLLTLVTFYPLSLFLKSTSKNQNNYLFINTGQLGDLILSSLIFTNSNLFPKNSQLYFIVRKEYAQIYKSYLGTIQIIEWDAWQYRYSLFHRYKFMRIIQSLNCNYAINITSGRGAISDELTLLSGAVTKVCFKINQKHMVKYFQNYYDSLYNYVIEFNTHNEFEKILNMIGWITKGIPKKQLRYFLYKDDYVYGREILNEIREHEADKIIIINPFTDLPEKDWANKNYKSLISLLSKHKNCKIILQGNKHQRNAIRKLIPDSAKNIYNLAGKFSLHESSALLSKADLFIGNDSGFSHIAIALGINMIGIIGCGSIDIFFPYPIGKNAFLKFKEVECKGCEWRCIHPTRICLDDVTPEEIYELSMEILDGNK